MLAYVFVLLALAVRLLPGIGYMSTMGFSPLAASLLFFGSRMPRKHFAVPLALLVLGDIFITTVKYHQAIDPTQGLIWAWYLGAFFLGSLLKDRVKPVYVAGVALTSAVSFFVVSNFGVWLFTPLYPHTLAGLTACYIAAIPFFERGLASDMVFSALFFSIPVAITYFNRETAKAAA
jgi:hypothetical protein